MRSHPDRHGHNHDGTHNDTTLENLACLSMPVFVLGIYSLPKKGKKDTFEELFNDVTPRQNSLLLVDDFNAAYPRGASWPCPSPAPGSPY